MKPRHLLLFVLVLVPTAVQAQEAALTTGLSAAEITALAIGLGSLIAVIFTGIVNIIVALRRNETKVDKAIAGVNEVSAKADVITGHVNSSATLAAAKIDALQNQILMLTQILGDTKTTAAVLAQAAATSATDAQASTAKAAAAAAAAVVQVAAEASKNPIEVTGPEGGPVQTVSAEGK